MQSNTPTELDVFSIGLRSAHQKNIDAFMLKAGQELPLEPTVPSSAVRILRAKLILEEAFETVKALGVGVMATEPPLGHDPGTAIADLINSKLEYFDCGSPDLVEIADGCADISVVTIGTLSACGISDRPLLEAIDQSNLDKFGPGGHRREDGKWVKPADWKKPDIASVLERMRL